MESVTAPDRQPIPPSAPPSTRAVEGRARRVVLIGNPNVGKSSVYMELTGQRTRVGNYPGITVERRSASLRGAEGVEIIDLPGAYSLSARSSEEQVTLRALLGLLGEQAPDVAVVVLDATQLSRNLYLALQVVELGIPCVLALNMWDEAQQRRPDPDAISRWLGVPCVATSARTGHGMEPLREAIRNAAADPKSVRPTPQDVPYPKAFLESLHHLEAHIPEEWTAGSDERRVALGIWALLSLTKDDELVGIPGKLRSTVVDELSHLHGLDEQIIASRWAHIDAQLPHLFQALKRPKATLSATDRVDKVLLHPALGFVIFIAIMACLFQALFSWAAPFMDLIEAGVGALQGLAAAWIPAGLFHDLISEGIIGGVGNVIVFLPQILLLFLFIGALEDTGYMARVAYLMDRIMKAMGLHGRAFVPMLSGFACAIPAVMATRTMESKRDRLLTMLVVPLISCSARLPVYTLIIAALFPPALVMGLLPVQALLMVGIYLFSTVVAILAAGILGRTVVKGQRMPLILELPPYRLPRVRSVVRMMFERSFIFVRQAGTIILVCTIFMWALLSFPRVDAPVPEAGARTGTAASTVAKTESAAPPIADSYGGMLGRAIEPAIAPLGFDWKIGVGIIGAFSAREVFVSTLAMVYGLDDPGEDDTTLRAQIQNAEDETGRAVYTPLMGLSLMVFFALACQCMSTLAVVRRETRSFKWPVFLFGYMTALAWVASFVVYQGGRLLGFS